MGTQGSVINRVVYTYPVAVLAVCIIFTIVVFMLNGWYVFFAYNKYSDAATIDITLHKNIGKIIHLDEILTMSARMGAVTGDPMWEKRYKIHEPKLDSIIKKTMELVPDSYESSVVAQTDTANIKLVEIEKRAFNYTNAGKLKEASAILFSNEYESQKKLYKEGMDKIIASINHRTDEELTTTKSQMIVLSVIGAFNTLFLSFTWIFILLLLKRALKQRSEAEAAIIKAKEEVETIVIERTHELREKSQQLEEFNRNLEKRVFEETEKRRLQEQMMIQQSKIAAMGEMIGAIAHQWRQPLNALGIMVQDIQDAYQFGELDDSYISKTVEESMHQIQYMSRTIDDFRNFYRSSKDKELFSVVKAVRNAISLHDAQLRHSNIDYRIDVTTNEDLEVNGYPNEFQQVVLNIISNARTAILEARTDGLLSNENGEILIDFVYNENKVIVNIMNNGKTIPEDIKNRIFEPYFTTKQTSEGTGIGLYMSKTIIEKNMDGMLYCTNTERGVQFTIELAAVLNKDILS